jgi:hypothetical protein
LPRVSNRRDDIAALTHEAADISGIQYVMDADREEAQAILDGKEAKLAPAKKSKAAHAR